MGQITRKILLGTAAWVMLTAPAMAQDAGWKGKAEAPRYREEIFPPWQHGANNDAANRGFDFTVPEVDVLADFHGDLTDPKLVLYVGGNYFFAMAPLVQAFEAAHPGYKGRIYWETIPPGLLIKQMEAGGTITVGNMTWTAKPDAYFAGLMKVKEFIGKGLLTGPAVPYVTRSPSWCPEATRRTSQAWRTWASPAFGWPCRTPSSKGSHGRSNWRSARPAARRLPTPFTTRR